MTFGVSTPTATVSSTGDNNIDALLIGSKWASTSVSFSFTDSFTYRITSLIPFRFDYTDYESNYPDVAVHSSTFRTLNETQRAVARAWIGSGGEFYNVSLLSPYELTGASDRDATIRIAMSNWDDVARVADFPSNVLSTNDFDNGDIWFNTRDENSNPIIGNYAYHLFGHELGHALGLKHGHAAGGVRNVAMNSDRDSMEFSIMTYRSYEGHDLDSLNHYTNETWGYAQSLMMYDIAAIQHMYGAWFGYNSGNTTYTFSTTTGEMFVNGVAQGRPGANRIFRTIWDGNGIDTYDFSNYTTNLSIDLTPGGWSDLNVGGNSQRAKLNDGYRGIVRYARGHVFNALQYNGDARSLIENANGGSGNDNIVGNIANNVLNGNNGNDTVAAAEGNDTAYGGNGNDFLGGWSGNDLLHGEVGNDSLYGDSGIDTLDGGAGNDLLFGHTDNLDVINTLGPDNNFDYLFGAEGNDTAYGGNGGDFLGGWSGNDYLSGDAGNDSLYGDSGIDTLVGGAGDDLLFGHTNSQSVIDLLGPDNNPDYLYGGLGNDTLFGGLGNDSLTGGSGIDILWGNQGADRFIFNYLSEGIDIIKDFQWTEGDKIQVSGSGFGAYSLNQFSYNSLTGALFFDPYGATGPTRFATIENRPAGFSTNLDLFII